MNINESRGKGFTLIELLAVIVILAVIALIATPIIIGIISDVKEQSVLRSAENIESAARNFFVAQDLNSITNKTTADLTKDITVSGTAPESGVATINTDGNIQMVLYLQGYCIQKTYTGKITASKEIQKENCKMGKITGTISTTGGFPKEANINIYVNDKIVATTKSNADGTFTAENLLDGEYKVVVTKKYYTSYTKNVVSVQNGTATVTPLLHVGDINQDSIVNFEDLNIVRAIQNYNKPIKDATNPECDINEDGFINASDSSMITNASNYDKPSIIE